MYCYPYRKSKVVTQLCNNFEIKMVTTLLQGCENLIILYKIVTTVYNLACYKVVAMSEGCYNLVTTLKLCHNLVTRLLQLCIYHMGICNCSLAAIASYLTLYCFRKNILVHISSSLHLVQFTLFVAKLNAYLSLVLACFCHGLQ